jgi:glycosyltransferase involved in cell wall biosynthesis
VSDLLVSTHTPILRSGQTLRTYGVALALARTRPLTLLYARFEGERPDAAFRAIPGIRLEEVVPSRGPRRAARYARARLGGVPAHFARGVSPELARAAERLAAGAQRVIADGPIAAAALGPLARRRPVIYNAHNLESSFRAELAEGWGPARGLDRFERRLLERSAESWMVSPADIEAAARLCPGARLRYVPNVVDVEAIAPVAGDPGLPRAVFVANFAYEPNRTGLAFLLTEVLPRVWERLPDASLSLVGAGLDAVSLPEDPRVERRGFVEDLAGAYGGARCAVVPLLQGGGTPLKFIEALAYGVPVLATHRAAAGLEVREGRDCLLASDADAFASALVRLLGGWDAQLAAGGRRVAAERYSIEALTRLLAA